MPKERLNIWNMGTTLDRDRSSFNGEMRERDDKELGLHSKLKRVDEATGTVKDGRTGSCSQCW